MTNNKLQKIAVIGTGIMGMPVASNLAKSGHKIFIYARRPKSIKKKLHRNMALCNNKEQLFKSSSHVSTCDTFGIKFLHTFFTLLLRSIFI